MAVEKIGFQHSLTAASDMTAATQQYCLVKLSATGVCLCTAETDVVLGVLQNNPSRGQAAEVVMQGISKVRVGASDLSLGNLIGVDTAGRAVALTSGTSVAYFPAGKVIQVDAADNDGGLVSAYIASPIARNG